MRIITVFLVMAVTGAADASLFSKKKAFDAEGNCIPELITENARLYSEIETLDQIATRAEVQLKSTVKESQKSGFDALKELATKAKATRRAIKAFGSTYADAACKAHVVKKDKKSPETVMVVVNQRVAELDKLATAYEQIADKFLRSRPANR